MIAGIETKLDEEIQEFITSNFPPNDAEKLLKLDPDLLLQNYLSDSLPGLISPQKADITEVRNYISRRYPRYLEYSTYHASLAGLHDQGSDVLHEVILSVLLKEESKIIGLYNKKGNKGLRDLDFYVLKMVKLNCHSLTSPYRWKHRGPKIDANTTSESLDEENEENEFTSLSTSDDENFEPFINLGNAEPVEEEPDEDPAELITTKFQIIRDILLGLDITERERQVFKWKFFLDCSWREWPTKENPRHLQAIFRNVKNLIIQEVSNLKEVHTKDLIHKVFIQARCMELKISESELLYLRENLSKQKKFYETVLCDCDLTPEDPAEVERQLKIVTKLENRLLTNLNDLFREFDIKNIF